jgi:hypothetical protein
LPFTAEAIRSVPRVRGTYFLFRGTTPVCAAVAAGGTTLQAELRARLKAGKAAATHFTWIQADDPLQAYRVQLAAHACWNSRGG